MIDRRFGILFPLSCLLALMGCSSDDGASAFTGQGGPTSPPASPPPPPPPPATGSFVSLNSDPGDFVGQGLVYGYSKSDSILTFTAEGGRLSVGVDGDELWSGEFQLPDTFTELEVGTYDNLTRYPFHDDAIGGLNWSGEGRGCNTLTGSFTIDSVTYDAGTLTDIELSFTQYCEGGSPALTGTIRYDADDPTVPPGPVADPGNLWAPDPADTPDTGNYIYLASESGEFVGDGPQAYTYTEATASVTMGTQDGLVAFGVDGLETWNGDFKGMNFLTELEVGYYGDLQRWPFHNPVKGGLNWSGEGRGCNTLVGWFVIDDIEYDTGASGALLSIDLRFEQRCNGPSEPALYGEISWAR